MSSWLTYTGCVVSLSHGSCWSTGVRNQTYFTLQGFSHLTAVQVFLFEGILLMFLITMTGNFLIIIVATTDPALHTPMYYFLKNLALLEICFTLNSAQDACWFVVWEKGHLLFCLCPTALFCHILHHFWVFPLGYYGIWPIYGYMPSVALHHNNEQENVSSYGHSMLDCWYSASCRTHGVAI